MELIDTHCHLDFEPLSGVSNPEYLQLTLGLAQAESVSTIVVPAVCASRWDAVLSVCNQVAPVKCIPALGMHPCFLAEHQADDILLLAQYLQTHPEVKALGECGLDLFIEEPREQQQIALFDAQIELAKQFELPLLLHGRRAVDQVIKRLRQYRPTAGGVLHAFSGSEQQAKQLWDLGFYIGLGGSITYDRAQRLRRVAKAVPLESILLETDAPDMPMNGFQGEPNWPHRVGYAARTLAEIRGVDVAEIAQQTSANARRLLRL